MKTVAIAGIFMVGAGLLALALNKEEIWVRSLPSCKFTVEVVDENGKPLEGALVRSSGGTYTESPLAIKKGMTDRNGKFVAEVKCKDEALYEASKDGYYETHSTRYLFKEKQGGRWLPWNPTFRVELKRIRNPIPMYAKRVEEKFPVIGKEIGFDLTAGDWVYPQHQGKIADLLIHVEQDKKNNDDYDFVLHVGFPNKGDGLQTFEAPEIGKGSVFRSGYSAPESGYKPELIQRRSRHPGKPTVWECDRNRCYYFRVRTVMDEKGYVASAMYGKIYGDFMHFTYYLNPTPNDRNVEFDPSKNLFKNLTSLEEVRNP